MAKGSGLTIGLNALDERHYGGWKPHLSSCEADARDLAGMAAAGGFEVTVLTGPDATRARVLGEMTQAADRLGRGDLFLVAFSGLGGQLPDVAGLSGDGSMLVSTWCVYDAQLLVDEVRDLLGRFHRGVRILAIVDACHSGTVTRAVHLGPRPRAPTGQRPQEWPRDVRYKFLPNEVAVRTYRQNKAQYDAWMAELASRRAAPRGPQASILWLAACQDNQLTEDGDFNGVFTEQLVRVWRRGAFRGGYRDLHRAVVRNLPASQTPLLSSLGITDERFGDARPFTVR